MQCKRRLNAVNIRLTGRVQYLRACQPPNYIRPYDRYIRPESEILVFGLVWFGQGVPAFKSFENVSHKVTNVGDKGMHRLLDV